MPTSDEMKVAQRHARLGQALPIFKEGDSDSLFPAPEFYDSAAISAGLFHLSSVDAASH